MMSNERNLFQTRRKGIRLKKLHVSLLCLVFILFCGVGGSFAYLITNTGPVKNTFLASEVDSKVEEKFDGVKKTNVNVTNTGDTDAYIRVKLISYRVNDAGDQIGGDAKVPDFTPGTGWEKIGDCYYYLYPVAPNAKPQTDLIGDAGISLRQNYDDDADGGRQVIAVMAEGIQSQPMEAVRDAWGAEVASVLQPAAGTTSSADSADAIIIDVE